MVGRKSSQRRKDQLLSQTSKGPLLGFEKPKIKDECSTCPIKQLVWAHLISSNIDSNNLEEVESKERV